MIFIVFWPFSLACGFGTIGLSLKRKIHTEHCYHLKVFFGVLGGSCDGDEIFCIAQCGNPLFGGVPNSIGITVPKRERGGAFLQKQEPGAIAVERSLILSN